MIQTLADVLKNREAITAELFKNGNRHGGSPFFGAAEMDGVVVFDDIVASKFLEAFYIYDTHIAPGRLPGAGMTIGDVLKHEENTYLTFHYGVATGNMAAVHYLRPYESLYVDWSAKYESVNKEVKDFIERVRSNYHECFGIKVIAEFNHISCYVGFDDIMAPSPEFVDALSVLARVLFKLKRKGTAEMARTAAALADSLKPYTVFQGLIKTIRKHHKGYPVIREDMIRLTSPTASGGANMHTGTVSDDINDAIPQGDGLFMVAIQAGAFANMQHFGTGSIPGQHYWLLPPRTPFFELVQKEVDSDSNLQKLWKKVSRRVGSGSSYWARSAEWEEATEAIKTKVARQVIPELISQRVLGFHLDMNEKPNVALIRPVVANSLFMADPSLVEQNGLTVIRPGYTDLLGEVSDGYFKFPIERKQSAAA